MNQGGKLLMVVTSAKAMGVHRTGLWLEEFAAPYLLFLQAGFEVVVASPLGGEAPIDPRSVAVGQPAAWQKAAEVLKQTRKLSEVEREVFDAIILPGGHGPMVDLAKDEALAALLQRADVDGWVIGAVCHGPAGLVRAQKEDCTPLVAGRRLTGFTNAEERMVQLEEAVPFLLENRLKELGAHYEHSKPWEAFVVRDGSWVTGQNPQSSEAFAKEVIVAVKENICVEC